eukprot:m.20460 g.20460  ORF g.20460 m.20460 type:complete len:71 (-) comp10216_c0_seq1:94-306(-)
MRDGGSIRVFLITFPGTRIWFAQEHHFYHLRTSWLHRDGITARTVPIADLNCTAKRAHTFSVTISPSDVA